jgi:hypothetical protein
MSAIATILVILMSASPDSWTKVAVDDGLTLESQSVEGSSYERLRVTGITKASAKAFMDAAWDVSDTRANPEVARREMLSDGPQERVYWDLVRAAPVSDRDVILKMSRRVDARGAYNARFDSISDDRKPEKDGVIRIIVRGTWHIVPLPSGGAEFTYEIYSDPAGDIPPFMVTAASRDAALRVARNARRRAEH